MALNDKFTLQEKVQYSMLNNREAAIYRAMSNALYEKLAVPTQELEDFIKYEDDTLTGDQFIELKSILTDLNRIQKELAEV